MKLKACPTCGTPTPELINSPAGMYYRCRRCKVSKLKPWADRRAAEEDWNEIESSTQIWSE